MVSNPRGWWKTPLRISLNGVRVREETVGVVRTNEMNDNVLWVPYQRLRSIPDLLSFAQLQSRPATNSRVVITTLQSSLYIALGIEWVTTILPTIDRTMGTVRDGVNAQVVFIKGVTRIHPRREDVES